MTRSAASGTILSLGTGTASIPSFLFGREDVPSDNVLVVIQLSGGNDGLNTVIPYKHPIYRKNRPSLAVANDQILDLDGDLGLHPGRA